MPPFKAVVRNNSKEVAWIVMRRWILVSGAFGRGKESSVCRLDRSTAVTSLFAIFQLSSKTGVLHVVAQAVMSLRGEVLGATLSIYTWSPNFQVHFKASIHSKLMSGVPVQDSQQFSFRTLIYFTWILLWWNALEEIVKFGFECHDLLIHNQGISFRFMLL